VGVRAGEARPNTHNFTLNCVTATIIRNLIEIERLAGFYSPRNDLGLILPVDQDRRPGGRAGSIGGATTAVRRADAACGGPVCPSGVARRRQIWVNLMLLGIINNAIPYTLISWGEQYIDSAVAAVLNSTTRLSP